MIGSLTVILEMQMEVWNGNGRAQDWCSGDHQRLRLAQGQFEPKFPISSDF